MLPKLLDKIKVEFLPKQSQKIIITAAREQGGTI